MQQLKDTSLYQQSIPENQLNQRSQHVINARKQLEDLRNNESERLQICRRQDEITAIEQRLLASNARARALQTQLQQRPPLQLYEDLRRHVSQLRSAQDVLQNRIDELTRRPTIEQHDEVVRALEDTEDSLARCQDRAADTEAIYMTDTAALKAELHGFKVDANRLKIDLYDLEDRFSKEVALRHVSERNLACMYDASLYYKAQLGALQKERDEETEDYVAQVEDHKAMKAERDSAIRRLNQLQTEFSVLEGEKAAVDDSCVQLRQEVSSLREKLDGSDRTGKELRQQLQSLETTRDALQKTSDEALVSTTCVELCRQLATSEEQKETVGRALGRLRSTLASTRQRGKARFRKVYTAFRQEEQSASNLQDQVQDMTATNAVLTTALDQSEATKSVLQNLLRRAQCQLTRQFNIHVFGWYTCRVRADDLATKLDGSQRANAVLADQVLTAQVSISAMTVLFAAAYSKSARQTRLHDDLVLNAQSKIRRLENSLQSLRTSLTNGSFRATARS